ncbi:LOW QUALITY PROTEIN: RIMS-binding protein 2-like [Pollicipes pollicipes]|uniref:LOW QUALITY PROTEIN: RIMS-binding protein 2-like n=1 Tax=Pollicipes pollicipes TaxID=41117 RepID=UPI001885377A|nr:LOW QUALITY PROTEIN: RIMS-binding protein 2-like [Pollicipes pollicipes]
MAPQQGASEGAGGEVPVAAPLQRDTLTSRQRERESELQCQIKERNAEIRRLKEQMKETSDRLSSRNEIQTLKEKGKRELATVIQQLRKQKSDMEKELSATIEALKNQRQADEEKFQSLQAENGALKDQLQDLTKLAQVHKELQRQFEDKIEECEQLAEGLQKKQELCNDLEKQFSRVIEKNTELTIQNSDLQRQALELDQLSTQCVSLEKSLTSVQAEYGTARMEVDNLRGKVSTLESVLKQMRDAAERKKELERQHQEAQQQLREKQADIQTLTKQSEADRQTSLDTIQSLESKVRELEKKAEVQGLRHEELMLEMSSLKKQNKYKGWPDGSPDGTITPDSMLLSNESTARSTPVGTAVTPASLEALTEVDETPGWSQRRTDFQLPATSTARSVATTLELDKIMAKIENDNKVLAELDKNRSTIGLSNSLATSGSTSTQPTFLTSVAAPLSAPYSAAGLMPAAAPAARQLTQMPTVYPGGKMGVMNGVIPGLLPMNVAQMMAPQPGVVDALDIPGKGKCQVHIARYSYDPFQHSPNEAPESELRLNAGDYVLVWADMDEDGFLDGETLDGRRGLVPSNFVQKLVGDDLLEFHRQVVAGLRDCDQTSVTTSVPQDLDFNSADEALLNSLDEYGPAVPPAVYGGDPSVFSDEEDADLRGDSALGTVPPPRQLTLERQLNKSVVIGWSPSEAPAGAIDSYHVYVDGLLRTTVHASERTRALIEGVDSTRPHRVSVRAVTPDRRASRAAACTMLIGRDVPSAPTAVRATHVTSTSAVISWMPSNSNHQHTVCVNSVEVRTVKPGVYRHTITGISPNTVYRVSVKVKNITAPQFNNRNGTSRERQATHIEFRTLPKGVPDPPVDVQCELGPQAGAILVTWLPVTINSTSGTSNGVPVTGYAVYADGKKVTELDSPTGDHALIDLQQITGFNPRQVTVRTKSRDLVSADSLPCPIPQRTNGKYAELELDELYAIPEESESDLSDLEEPLRMRHQPEPTGSAHSSPRLRRRMPPAGAPQRGRPNQQHVLETEENLSDREAYPGSYGSVPHIEVTKDSPSGGGVPSGYGEDEYETRGQWGQRRRPADRGRPPAAPHHAEPPRRGPAGPPERDPRGRRRTDEYGDPPAGRGGRHSDNGSGYRSGTHSSSAPARRGGPREERMRIFVALFDYDPPTMSPNPDACEDELPFREGQLIKIYGEKDADGFYWGEASGRAGYVPCNMVSEVQVDDEHTAHEMLREDDRTGRQTGRPRASGEGRGGRSRGQEDRWGDIYSSTPVRRMVALYDYDPQELSPNVDAEVELSFSTGDIIHVYGDMDDDGFYLGDINGVRGLVPSNFLTDAPQNYERRRAHEPAGAAAAAERGGRPGPGVLGPPLPPRDKGDSRDRRKGHPFDCGPACCQRSCVALVRRHSGRIVVV